MGKNKHPYANRIIGTGVKPAGEFLANEHNWRIHPKAQQEALDGVLSEVGWVQNVIENARTGRLIDGHARIVLALRQGEDTPVPYTQVDLSEEEESLILLSLDPIASLAATDKAQMDALMRQVQTDDERVQQYLADLAEREGLDYGKQEPKEDPGAQVGRVKSAVAWIRRRFTRRGVRREKRKKGRRSG